MKRILLIVALSICVLTVFSQNQPQAQNNPKEQAWVDSVLNGMTLDEKFAQLMIIRVPTPKSEAAIRNLAENIKDLKPGGVTFFKGDPLSQAKTTNAIQAASEVPMIISIDGEWGLAMRLDHTLAFPYQMALGAVQDNDLIYEMGKEIARQCKRVGIQLNFAPVIDINNNPSNPVINYRSFGENKFNVAQKGYAYASGMEDEGILVSIKHFPGHGDTDTDSHLALPVLNFSTERLDSLELYPFKYIIEKGVTGVMVGHLNIPAWEQEETRASSLSKPIVTDILKEKLGFEGLVMTDALEMKGIANHYGPGRASVESFKAGNDVLLLPGEPEMAIGELKKALKKKEITLKELDAKVSKLLTVKYRIGLSDLKPVELTNLVEELNSPEIKLLKRKLVEASLTVIENNDNILPLQNLESTRFASLSVGAESKTFFQATLEKYAPVDHYQIDKNGSQLDGLKRKLQDYDVVIVGLHDEQARPANNAYYSEAVYAFLNELAKEQKVVVASFRNAYTLEFLMGTDRVEALVCAYSDDPDTEDLTAQLIFGGISSSGKLPVGIGMKYKEGHGIDIKGGIRFKYTLPEELGIDSRILNIKIDSIMQLGMDSAAFPGGEVLLAKDQKVFFQKTYGFHTYENEQPVKDEDLFDFASVTKITGPLPALMMLYDQGKFSLDAKMAEYVPEMKGSNKENMDWRNVLAHNARLKSWIPYWTTTTKKNGKFKRKTLSESHSEKYNYKLSDNLFMYKEYEKTIYKLIRNSELNEKPGYVYSGLSFYLYPRMISEMTGENYEKFLKENIYRPLGAYTITFNPSEEYGLSRIVPTEVDTFFRKMPLHGVVHDEGAAMMKGVSGNAGLFGTANDLAKLMQMYLNMGEYGGRRYINKETMKEFTSCQFCEQNNHRGLGFDKIQLNAPEKQSAAPSASESSFGHSGYTGTFTWADPENSLLYVFFSNRVYPTRYNSKIYSLNIRPAIHQIAYDLMK